MRTYIKKFAEWLHIKTAIDFSDHKPPFFREREVWWCSVGENVGVEISGKGAYFRRPILIVRKLDRYSFIGTPLTSTIRQGDWYAHVTLTGITNTVLITQLRHFDYRRLNKKISAISKNEHDVVIKSIIKLFSK